MTVTEFNSVTVILLLCTIKVVAYLWRRFVL